MDTRIARKRALWYLISAIYFSYAPVLAQEAKAAENGKIDHDAVKIEEGEPAPYSGFLISEKKLTKCLQAKIDLASSIEIADKQREVIEAYESKDVSVKELTDSVDQLAEVLDHYKTIVDDLIDTQKPKFKFPKWGFYGGVNSLTLDSKVGTGYNAGVFISF